MHEGRYGTVVSPDGTTIGYQRAGEGPVPLVALHGGTADRTRWQVVAPLLAEHHAVWLVDRRGRGLSGDAPAYDLDREVDDLVSVVAAAGPGTVLLAHSFGATVALRAAPRLERLAGMVLYEPAFETPGHVMVNEAAFATLEGLLAAGNRERALQRFFRDVVGLSPVAVESRRPTWIWEARLAAVHTLTREGRAARAFRLQPEGLRSLPYPVLVMAGTESPAWLRSAAQAAHEALPGSGLVELDGQAHMAMDTAPEAFAREVSSFVRSCAAAHSR